MVCVNICGVSQEVGRLSLVHVSTPRCFELLLGFVAAASVLCAYGMGGHICGVQQSGLRVVGVWH